MCGICGCERPHQLLTLHQSLLSRNNHQAEHNRAHFHHHGLLAVNLLSAPGSGKTALLEQLARHWPQRPVGVIVGDLATDNDARRLQAAGARALQIRTGDLCHLEANQVDAAFAQLDISGMNLLVIENVGNLVCPTAFDLGEQLRLAMLSVTEGEDKPLKYPALFQSADAVVINKSDLADAVGFQRQEALANLRSIAPQARVFELSARTGSGLEAVVDWLSQHLPVAEPHGPHP
jgi:hydrogenase nickel incorporation protein HypB